MRLVLYEKELGAKEVHRLISLNSFLNQNYHLCSKALSNLETLSTLTKDTNIKIHIFIMNEPKKHNEFFVKCPNKKCESQVSEIDCKNCGSNFSP